MRIESTSQINELRTNIYDNAMKTYNRIVQDISNVSPFELFADIKFNKFGLDPISGTPLNFIEQLNQMFSDLIVLNAAEELLSKYPDKTFVVNFGAKAGFDIQSTDKAVVAECFAVTTIDSNSKLKRDAKKLMRLTSNHEKYIFFYSQDDLNEKVEKACVKYPEIKFRRMAQIK